MPPCNCDHLESTQLEQSLSRVACLLDELDGKKINKSHWDGYHPLVYGKAESARGLVAKLCDKLQVTDVTKCSLEMQIWWRDHLREDNARLKREMKDLKTKKERDAAIAKLTKHERKLLGL